MKKKIKNNMLLASGLLMLIIIIFFLIFGPSLCKHDPEAVDYSNQLKSPSAEYIFGTDASGRSIAARVIYGARISLGVAFSVVVISVMIGVSIGVISGYIGGTFDYIVMRIVEVMLSFPGTVLALAILGTIGIGIKNQIIALTFVSWARYARISRDETIAIKNSEYIVAARAIGNGKLRMIFKYILPNIMSRLIIVATMGVGPVILAGAALSFLGLGAQIPTPEWGLMINEGREYIRTAPYISIFPGLAAIMAALCFNLIGEGLSDKFDPRLKEKAVED